MKLLTLIVTALLAFPPAVRAATIKKSNGDVIEGKIEGLIILKTVAEQEPDPRKPDVVRFSVTYWLLNGDEIVRIDELGVERETDEIEAYGLAEREGAVPDDLTVLDKVFDMRSPQTSFGPTTDPNTWVVAAGRAQSKTGRILAVPLLGEYRRDPRAAHGQLIPAIHVVTPTRIITLPVTEVIAITKR